MEGGKPENPEENPRSKDDNQQQIQPTYDAEPGPHWWEASALTTAPSLCLVSILRNISRYGLPSVGEVSMDDMISASIQFSARLLRETFEVHKYAKKKSAVLIHR